jgi:hypothetical protein
MLRILVYGLVEGALLFQASRVADPLAHLVDFLWPYAAAFVVALHAFRSLRLRAPQGRGPLLLILALGAAFRVLFLPAEPSLSGDVHRYVWDARAQAAGVNPYLFAPAAPEVRDLYDDGARRINHPEVSTIYPPISQLVFRAAQGIHPGPPGMKIAFAALDLCAAVVALWALAPPLAHRCAFLVLLAWHPLAIVETAASGHNDPLAILCLLAAIGFARRRKALGAGALLGAAAAAKTLPLALAPLFLLALGRAGAFRFVAAAAAAILFAYFPFASAGAALFRGLSVFALELEANAGLFAAARWTLDWFGVPSEPSRWVLRALPLVVIAATPFIWRAAGRDLARAAFWTLAGLILVSSQVHPWYLLWLLPFLALSPSRAWLAFTFLVALSYETHALYAATGVWREPNAIRAAQYVPLYALLAVELIARRRARPPAPAAAA